MSDVGTAEKLAVSTGELWNGNSLTRPPAGNGMDRKAGNADDAFPAFLRVPVSSLAFTACLR